MPIKAHITGLGTAPATAAAIVGGVNTGTSGAGTTAAGAALLPLAGTHYIATAANNSGVILPPGNGSGDGLSAGDSMLIFNADANALLIYPPTGGKLNNGTATTGTVSIATHTSVRATCIDNLNFIVEGPST